MNLDITVCEGTGCPLAALCLRKAAWELGVVDRKPWLSAFVTPPVVFGKDPDGRDFAECDYYLPRREYENLNDLSAINPDLDKSPDGFADPD